MLRCSIDAIMATANCESELITEIKFLKNETNMKVKKDLYADESDPPVSLLE